MAMPTKGNEGNNTVYTKVAEQIKELGPTVEAKIIATMVEREEKKRADAWVIVHDALRKLENEFKRIKPDLVAYDESGKEISASYSKAKFEERKKAGEKIEKCKKALNKALEQKDFGDVYQLSAGKDTGDDGSEA